MQIDNFFTLWQYEDHRGIRVENSKCRRANSRRLKINVFITKKTWKNLKFSLKIAEFFPTRKTGKILSILLVFARQKKKKE